MAGLFDAETETLARAFAASSAAFLERLRWMTATLGRPYESFDAETRLISAGCVSVRKIRSPEDWRPQLEWNPPEIDMRAFSTHARQTREGWLIAREFNAELSKFDCATLERLTSWILKTHGGSEVTTLRVAVVDLFKIMEEFVQVVLEFHQAVERFELVLSMTAAAVPVAPGAEFVDSDYAEPTFKSDLAFLFGVDRATISRRIQSGELRTLPGTSDTAKKVRVHGDDFPAGLKRLNERKQKLSTMPKRRKRQ